MKLPLILGSYTAQNLIAEAQRCINLYGENNPPDAPFPFTFLPTPGLEFLGTAPGGTVTSPIPMSVGTGTTRYLWLYNDEFEIAAPAPAVVNNNTLDLTYTSDGLLLGVLSSTAQQVAIFHTADMTQVVTGVTWPAALNRIAYSPDGAFFAVCSNNSPYLWVYDTATWLTVTITSPPTTLMSALKFSPDSNLLCVTGFFGETNVYQTSDWSKNAALAVPPTSHAYDVDFSTSGNRMAVAHTGSPYVSIYNTTTWAKIANPVSLPPSNCRCVAFSPDDVMAVGTSAAPWVKLYNTTDWSVISPGITQTLGDYPLRLAFSPNGDYFASATNINPGFQLYNTFDWSRRDPLTVPPLGDCYVVAFAP